MPRYVALGLQTLQERMRRSLQPTHFGPGTGYRTFENTMPMRDIFRDGAIRRGFEDGSLDLRTLPNFQAPRNMPLPPRPPTAPEKLESTAFISGQGLVCCRNGTCACLYGAYGSQA